MSGGSPRYAEDPTGYLREPLDAHERQEHACRRLNPDVPDLLLNSATGQ
ncbi:hypothetical protein ACFW4M_20985 [Streptomyces sp. NPDC058794]